MNKSILVATLMSCGEDAFFCIYSFLCVAKFVIQNVSITFVLTYLKTNITQQCSNRLNSKK